MKNITLIALTLFIFGCSNSNQSPVVPPSSNQGEESGTVIDVSRIQVDPTGSVSPQVLVLGETSATLTSISQDITVKNSSLTMALPIAISISSDPGFKITNNRCGTTLAARGGSCIVSVSFANRALYNGDNYTAMLNITPTFQMQLKATIVGLPDPNADDSKPDLALTLDSPFSVPNPVVYRTLTIVNNGAGTAKNLIVYIPAMYAIRLNRCPTDLKPRITCTMQVTYVDNRSTTPPPSANITVDSSNSTAPADLNLQSGIQYVLTFTPPTNPNLAICGGTQSLTPTPVCHETSATGPVALLSLCNVAGTPNLPVSFKSPAGESTDFVSITGGKKYQTCEEGVSVKVDSRVECNTPSYVASGLTCVAQAFDATYADITSPVPNACDGTITGVQNIVPGSCKNTATQAVVADSLCSPTKPKDYKSPAGESPLFLTITGGKKFQSCLEGVSVKVDSRVECDSPVYLPSDLICVAQAFDGTYADAVNPVPNACDGTLSSDKLLTPGTCKNTVTSDVVADSFCLPTKPQEFKSPAGNFSPDAVIANGSEKYSCAEGLQVKVFVSRSCDSGYLDNGTSCILAATGFQSIGIGYNHSCGLDQQNKISCWGGNNDDPNNRTVGSQYQANFLSPTLIDDSGDLSGKNISKLAVGWYYSYAIADGKVYAWGQDQFGYKLLGNSSVVGLPALLNVPILVGKTIKDISIGSVSACVLDSDNKPYCWGQSNVNFTNGNSLGGLEAAGVHPEGVAVISNASLAGKNLVQISVGGRATCVLDILGKIYCWGGNLHGNLGNGTTSDSGTPSPVFDTGVLLGKTIVKIAMGDETAFALDSNGKLYGWGSNLSSLGNGLSSGQSTVPIAIAPSLTFSDIAYNSLHGFALATDGKIYSWGRGQERGAPCLARGSPSPNILTPIQIISGDLAGKTIVKIFASSDGGGAIDSTGKAYIWGSPLYGKLGTGNTFAGDYIPALVVVP
jgi:alpha-tubulin suppressor-like RCC1 family protein